MIGMGPTLDGLRECLRKLCGSLSHPSRMSAGGIYKDLGALADAPQQGHPGLMGWRQWLAYVCSGRCYLF